MNPLTLLPTFAFAVMSFGLVLAAIWMWNRRPPLSHTAAALMLVCAAWVLAWTLALLSADLALKTALLLARFAAIAATPTLWLILALQYSGHTAWLTRRRLIALASPLFLLWLVLLTNPWHELIYQHIQLDPNDPLLVLHSQHGPGFWVFTAYAYALLVTGNLVIIRMLAHSFSLYRRQAITLIIAAALPGVCGLADVFLGDRLSIPATPPALGLACLIVSVTLIRLRRGDILSVARDTIIDGLSDGIVVIDNFERIVSLNPAAERLITPSIDHPIGQILQQAWPDLAKTLHDSRLTVQNPIEIALPGTHEPRLFDVRLTALRDTTDRVTSRIVTLRDISERKRAEFRLAKLNERFLKFGSNPDENINQLVALCGEQLNATYALYNQLQGGRLRALGQWQAPNDYQTIDHAQGHICHDIIERAADTPVAIRNLATTPYQATDPNVTFYNLRTYVGTVVKSNQTAVGSLCVVYQSDVEPRADDLQLMSIIASAIGIEEERRQAQAALRNSESRLRLLTDNMLDLIVQIDAAGIISYVSPSIRLLLGYEPAQLLGRPALDLSHPADVEPMLTRLSTALQMGQSVTFESRALRADGQTIWLESMANPVVDQQQTVGLVVTSRDITQRKATEQREREQLLALQRQTTQQAALLAASSAISSSLDLSTVLHRLAEEMGRAIDVTSTYILDWEPRTGTARVLAEWISPKAAPRERRSDVGNLYRVAQEFGDDLDGWLIPGQPIVTQLNDPLIHPGQRAHLLENDGRSTLKIPLVIKDQSIGYADLWESRRAREFSLDEIALCQSIAQHAAIAIENARLYASATQQAEHNAGLIEVTRAINSTMNVPDLLGLIIDNVAGLIKAQHGSLWLLNEAGTHLSIQAMYNLPNLTSATQLAIGEGIAGWVAQTGQPVIIDNVDEDPRYMTLLGSDQLRAMVCVPLIGRGHVIGVLSLDRYDDEPPFSESEFRTIQDYAQHATLALTKARLMEAAQLQLDQLQAIYQLSDAVAQAGSIDDIFQTALDTLLRTTHADRAAILLLDPDGVMRFKAWRGLSDYYRQQAEGHTPWPPDVIDPQPVLIEDIERESSLAKLRPTIVSEGLRALGFIPLINQRQLLGKFMIYYNQPHLFTETQVAQTVAYHVSFAIVRLRARIALRESEARFRALIESQGEGVSLIDPEENCLFANPAANTIFGVETLDGRNLREFTSPEQFAQLRAQTERRRRGERSTYDLEIVRSDGERRNLIVTATPQQDAAGNFAGALTVWLDITERKRAEERLKASLLEKDVLLKEIHHRVKNNLQVVHSLLNLQSNQTTDAATLDVLRDSQNRVRSMALVHETLYRSPDLARVDFAEYASSLAAHLAQSYRIDSAAIQLSVQAASDVRLSIDIAIPCGLIINELVSNALKHAFPCGRTGTVTVRLAHTTAEEIAMTVADNGIGLPPDFDYTQTESLGLQLIGQLVRQIHGRLTVQRDSGTHFTIEFQAH